MRSTLMAEVVVRVAETSDLPSIIDLVKREGRLISFEDEFRTWMKVDPEAIHIAEHTRDSTVLGVCVGTILSDDRGFMGLYIVKKEFRGQGIGTRVWDAAMEHLGDRNVGVCGYDQSYDKYKDKYGFRYVPDYKIRYYVCFGSEFPSQPADDADMLTVSMVSSNLLSNREMYVTPESSDSPFLCVEDSMTSVNVIENHRNIDRGQDLNVIVKSSSGNQFFSEDLLEKIHTYDQSLHGYDRSLVVKDMFHWPSCKTTVVLSRSGDVLGYGCLRPVMTGHTIISPLYADSSHIAEIILRNLLRGLDIQNIPKGVVIGFPDSNKACCRLVEEYGFNELDTIVRTGFTKSLISSNVSKIYALQSTIFCTE